MYSTWEYCIRAAQVGLLVRNELLTEQRRKYSCLFLDQHVNDWLSSDGSDHAVSNPTVCSTPCQRLDYPQHVVDIKMTSKSLLMLIIGGPKVNPSPS